jgi:hypothetical protein
MIQKLPASENLGWLRGQKSQQIELSSREFDRRAAHRNHSPSRVDLQALELHGNRGRRPGRTTHNRSDPGHQLAGGERLHYVIVGAHLQSTDSIDFLRPSGEENHGQVTPLSDFLQKVESRHSRQHQIEHNQVGVKLVQKSAGGLPLGRSLDAVPLSSQITSHHFSHSSLIVDEQDPISV